MTSPCRLAAVLLALLAAASPTGADEEEMAWRDTDVARVADRALTWDDLCRAAVDFMTPQLADRQAPAFANYATILFDRVLDELCREHEVAVSQEALETARQELDAKVRAARGKSLADAMREQFIPRRAQDRDLVRQLRVAALQAQDVDVGAGWEAADIRRALRTADHPEPAALPEGVVATVNGGPVTDVEYGDRLLSYAGPRLVGEILDRACRVHLVEGLGVQLDDATLTAELAYLSALAPLEERFDPEEVWQQFSVRGGQARESSWTEETVRQSAFARSLLGLVRRYREDATQADVVRAWERSRATLYGPHVLVTSAAVEFRTAGDVFAPATGRTRAEARTLARTARRLLAEGLDLEAVATRLDAAGQEGVEVTRLRLYPTDRNRLLWEQADTLADGETGVLVETLSAFHALRREGAEAAPAFERVELLVRERLARERARRWLDDQLADSEVIRRRWPPPQLR